MSNLFFQFFIIVLSLKLLLAQENEENEEVYVSYEYDELIAPNPVKIEQILNNITNPSIYSKNVRPTGINGTDDNIDKKGALILKVMLSYRQLMMLDEKNQILTSSFYIMTEWSDPRLKWDPNAYSNIESIIVPASNFWLPDIAIINAASAPNMVQYPSNLNALITHNGTMFLTVLIPTQQTRCKLDVYKYPFDTQTCSIIIGSWYFNTKELNFMAMNVSTVSYTNHSIWKLISIESKTITNNNRYSLINSQFSKNGLIEIKAEDVNFVLTFKRNPLYIMINGIFPCLILNCIILIAFSIPYAQQVNLCKI
jgi:hypothetical protein